jgi:hypothetical protein
MPETPRELADHLEREERARFDNTFPAILTVAVVGSETHGSASSHGSIL